VTEKVTLQKLVTWVRERAGIPLQPDEGVQIGRGDRPVSRLLFSWIPDWRAVRKAIAWKADFLIGHESFYFPYNTNVRNDRDSGWADWPYNRDRQNSLEQAGIGYARFHHIADYLSIFDSVADLLQLGSPVVDKSGFVKVFQIQPVKLGDLVERVKRVFGLRTVRACIPAGMTLENSIERVGLPWGGMGLNVNITYMQALIQEGCDVVIAGESDNIAMRFAVDQGIPLIESSHDVNEAPGWRAFADLIQAAHPQLTVRTVDPYCIWKAL
jgi:putative NIF3 family GTP cyclohydrolase 1 type 2